MYSLFSSVTRVVVFFLVVSLTAGSVFAASHIDTSQLRDDVTLGAIRGHQAALQAAADANGGTRSSGTPGFDASTAYVVTQLEAVGYAVTIQPFNYPFFQELSTPVFEQLAPVATTYPPNDPAGFSTMTHSGSGDVTALIEAVDIVIPPGPSANTSTSGCEPSDFAGFTPGRIALLQRGSCFFQTKAVNAQAAGAVGVIIFNEGQPGRTAVINGTLINPLVTVPVISTSFAIGESLYTASMGTNVTVRIFVDAVSDYRDTQNVIAELPGQRDRVIMAGAHLDSVPEGPGINDNGSGSSALLEIARQMKLLGITPRNTVRFAWWGAEESGLVGSDYYVNNLTNDEIINIGAFLELEMLGSPNFVRFVYDGDGSDFPSPASPDSAAIEQVLNDYFADQGLLVEPTPLDLRHSYRSFAVVGIAVGGLFGGAEGIKTADQAADFGGTAGDQYDPCYHLACDTFDNVSLQALDEMSDAAAHTILTLAQRGVKAPNLVPNKPPSCEDLGYDFGLKIEAGNCRQSPSYWSKNPGAWLVDSIDVGGVNYSKSEAIAVMNTKAKGDNTYAMFNETVAAKLNVLTCGPFSSAIDDLIAAADDWLASWPPGSGVKSKDPEWDSGKPILNDLKAFNGNSFQSGIHPIDGLGFVEIITDDGIYFDWISTRSADAVIAKGGRGANIYEYDPEAFSDIDLHAPINPKNDIPYALSYIEFCFDFDVEISVRKFHDVDGDGVWDPGEPEIGVNVFLLPDSTLGGTAGWPYLFTYPMNGGTSTDLFWTPETHVRSFAGTYTVEEFLLPRWEQTALFLNGASQLVTPQIDIFYAGDADETYEVIFGNIGYAEIQGMKFHDLDGDGVKDAAEPPLPGVEITLDGTDFQGNAVELRIDTGIGGDFIFTRLLPGDYTATETAFPVGGWAHSTPLSSGPHSVVTGELLDLEWVFGNYLPGSIHGYKFKDVNANGIDDDEPRLPGVTIELTGDVDGDGDIDQLSTTTEGPGGEYWFVDLYPGDYIVSEIAPAGWIATTPESVNVTVTSGVELVALAGQAMLTPEQIEAGYEEVIDERLVFGNSEFGSIHPLKFKDVNADGVYDPEVDQPLPGVEFTLTGIDGMGNPVGPIVETSMNDDPNTPEDDTGLVWFTDLKPGVYTITELIPAGYMTSTHDMADPSVTVTIVSGQEYVALPGQAGLPDPVVPPSMKFETVDERLAFGNFENGSIHALKYKDLNANGARDPNEPGLAGVDFELTGTDGMGNSVGPIDESSMDDGGVWFVNLKPGVYTITELIPAGYMTSTHDMADPSVTVTIVSGQEYVALPGQAGLPDPVVPPSMKFETVDERLLFGNFEKGSIHALKFKDVDANGIYEPGVDQRLPGVEFTLTGTDGMGNPVGPIVETSMDDDPNTPEDDTGLVWFIDLKPGTYTLTETIPDGWMTSTHDMNDPSVTVTIVSGQEYVAVPGLAGLPDPVVPPSMKFETQDNRLLFGNFEKGSIHPLKFKDVNADGVYDPAVDQPLPGVEFTLTGIDGMGNPVGPIVETSMDDDPNTPEDDTGLLWFTDLKPGTYTLTENIPAGWMTSTHDMDNPSVTVTIVSGQEYVAIDGLAGLPNPVPPSMKFETQDNRLLFGNFELGSIHGVKFKDVDGNGAYDPNVDQRIPDWTIELHEDGQVLQTTTTNDSGEYWFTDLDPGTYFVTEQAEVGWIRTTLHPPPLTIVSGQEWVAEAGQAMLPPGTTKFETVQPLLAFGNFELGSIHGVKFKDVDGNGAYDPNVDQRIPGWSIELHENGQELQTTTTDDNGEYWFTGLSAGEYTVTESPEVGWVQTTANPATMTIFSGYEYVAMAGQSMPNPGITMKTEILWDGLAFGNFELGSIHGYKFDDENANGIDDNEPRLQGVTIVLTGDVDGDGDIDQLSTTTEGPGAEYWFTGLYPGEYTVSEIPPAGSVQTTADPPPLVLDQSGQEYVAEPGQSMPNPGITMKFEVLEPLLAFGNSEGIAATFTVTKDFSDNNPASVDMTLTCTSGTVAVNPLPAAEGNPAIFDVTGFLPGATCTATEAATPGYTQDISDCQNGDPVDGGCLMVNTLNAATFTVTKDFSDNNPAPVEMTLTCTSGTVADNPLPAAEGSPAIFDVTGFLPGATCTATEAATPDYTQDISDCQDGDPVDGGCLMVNTSNAPKFTVTKDFSDDNPAPVDMTLTCTSGTVAVNPLPAAEGNPAIFDVTGSDPGATCTATEAATPGYTQDISDCQNGDPVGGGCLMVNTLINEPPDAVDDAYDATGNVGIDVPAGAGLLANDSDPNPGDILTVTPASFTTVPVGGSVNIVADGSFSYTPPAGYTGSDTFDYTLDDNAGGTDTGMVTITVSDRFWFIDNSLVDAGDGTLADPFNLLSLFEGSALPGSGDCIFIHTGSGAYSGPLTLLANQVVVGQGSTADIPTVCSQITLAAYSNTLPTTGGTRPQITSASDGIVLANTNTVRGLNIGDIGGSGFKGTAVGTLNISEVAIGVGTPSGGGIEVATSGTLDIVLDSLSASSNTDEGIRLNNVSGSFAVTATNGTISTTNVAAIDIDGDNSLNVNINALTFASVSADGASTASNGIILMDTTGSFTVTGDGSTATQGGNDTGGVIENTTGDGIVLINANNISLQNITIGDTTASDLDSPDAINNIDGDGIEATAVTDLTLSNITIARTAGHGLNAVSVAAAPSITNLIVDNSLILNAGDGQEEHGLNLDELRGDNFVLDSLFDAFNETGIELVNTSGTVDLTVADTTFQDNQATVGNAGEEAILLEAQTGADIVVLVTGTAFPGTTSSIFDDIARQAIQAISSGAGSDIHLTVENSNFLENSAGDAVIIMNPDGGGDGNVTVKNNTFTDDTFGPFALLAKNDSSGTLDATIQANTVTNMQLLNVNHDNIGSAGAANGTSRVLVGGVALGNTVNVGTNNIAVDIIATETPSTGSAPDLSLTVLNNTTSQPDGNFTFAPGLRVDVQQATRANVNISGNSFQGDPTFAGGSGIEARELDSAILGLEGFAGGTVAAAMTFIDTANPGSQAASFVTSGVDGNISTGAATAPTATTLPNP